MIEKFRKSENKHQLNRKVRKDKITKHLSFAPILYAPLQKIIINLLLLDWSLSTIRKEIHIYLLILLPGLKY